MKLSEAKAVAANPSASPDALRLARLKLGNAALRAFPSSPVQKELRKLIENIETMPRELWSYR